MNKKAQVGETLTWTVATIIIIVILVIPIIFVISLGSRGFTFEERDLVVVKSMSSYLLTENNWKDINEGVANGNMANFNDNDLNKKIFYEFYKENYPDLKWLGIVEYIGASISGIYSPISDGSFIGQRMACNTFSTKRRVCIEERFKLKNDKFLEFIGGDK